MIVYRVFVFDGHRRTFLGAEHSREAAELHAATLAQELRDQGYHAWHAEGGISYVPRSYVVNAFDEDDRQQRKRGHGI